LWLSGAANQTSFANRILPPSSCSSIGYRKSHTRSPPLVLSSSKPVVCRKKNSAAQFLQFHWLQGESVKSSPTSSQQQQTSRLLQTEFCRPVSAIPCCKVRVSRPLPLVLSSTKPVVFRKQNSTTQFLHFSWLKGE
jgi:hypothetical protein